MPISKLFFTEKAAIKLISFFLPIALMTGCAAPTSMGYGSDRKQFVLTTKNFPINRANKKTVDAPTLSKRVYHLEYERRVLNIFNHLIPYADQYLDKDINIKWDMAMFPSEKTTVGALANGVIIMDTGFPNKPMMNDDALAYIIAHEMAHVIRQHHREKDTWNFILRPALIGTAFLSSGTLAITTAVVHDFNSIAYRKRLEKEADLLGLEIAAKAGFNPEIATDVFDAYDSVLKKEYPIISRLPFFMTSHPSNKKRTKYTKEYLSAAMPLYEESKTLPPLQAKKPVTVSSGTVTTIPPHPTKPKQNNGHLADTALQEQELAATK